MATKDVVLPDIGEGVTEGELVKYLVKVGDPVKEDQPVAEIMTDKATVEVPSPFTGTVKELKCKEGEIIGIGKPLVVLETSGGATITPQPTKTHSPAPTAMMTAAPVATAALTSTLASTLVSTPASSPAPLMTSGGLEVYPPVANSTVLATPGTRRLAREMGVNINTLTGTGNAGRVTREDVIRSTPTPHAPTSTPTPTMARSTTAGAEERVPLKGIRRKIAESMQLSKRIIPHFTLMDEANVTALVEMRNQLKPMADKAGIKITYLPFVMKALIATAREFPMFNASIDDNAQEIVYKKFFNLGFAADTPNGLLVPVIKDADHKTIQHISREIVELAGKARDGKLALEDMKGATMTITNIGSIGGNYATPIINHPEVVILGMYKITDKPIWDGSKFVPAKMMNFTVTADHRLIDGAVAANFLKAFINRIENPSLLMMDMM